MDSIEFDHDPGAGIVKMRSPYNERFKDVFKQIVPYEARRKEDGLGWLAEEAVWAFQDDYYDDVKALSERYFGRDPRAARLRDCLLRRRKEG